MLISSMYKIKRKIRIHKNKYKWKTDYVWVLSDKFIIYCKNGGNNE